MTEIFWWDRIIGLSHKGEAMTDNHVYFQTESRTDSMVNFGTLIDESGEVGYFIDGNSEAKGDFLLVEEY